MAKKDNEKNFQIKLSGKFKNDIIGYVFIAPNVIIFLTFFIIPVLFSLGISFTDWDYTRGFETISFTGVENYINMVSDEWFVASLINTIKLVVGTVPITIILALVTAYLLERYVIGKQFARLMLFLPYISNIVAISVVWKMMYSPFGPITELLKFIGIENPPNWLGTYEWALPAVIIMTVWINVGYCVLIYCSAIQSLPDDVMEAAIIDGANERQKFFNVTVPMLKPNTFFLTMTSLIASFQIFGQINVMTKGGPGTSTHVLVYYIYTSAFKFFKMGYASAISWVMFIIIFTITIVQWKLQKRYEA